MNGTPSNKKKKRGVLRALSFSSQIGITTASCLFIGVWLGQALDRWLATSPWLLLVCSLLGAGAAMKALFSLGKK